MFANLAFQVLSIKLDTNLLHGKSISMEFANGFIKIIICSLGSCSILPYYVISQK